MSSSAPAPKAASAFTAGQLSTLRQQISAFRLLKADTRARLTPEVLASTQPPPLESSPAGRSSDGAVPPEPSPSPSALATPAPANGHPAASPAAPEASNGADPAPSSGPAPGLAPSLASTASLAGPAPSVPAAAAGEAAPAPPTPAPSSVIVSPAGGSICGLRPPPQPPAVSAPGPALATTEVLALICAERSRRESARAHAVLRYLQVQLGEGSEARHGLGREDGAAAASGQPPPLRPSLLAPPASSLPHKGACMRALRALRLVGAQAALRAAVEAEGAAIGALPAARHRALLRAHRAARIDGARREIAARAERGAGRARDAKAWRSEILAERVGPLREALAARNRGILRVHERLARERTRARGDDRAMRLEALRAHDFEAYQEMLRAEAGGAGGGGGDERYQAISKFLADTEEYLRRLGGKIAGVKLSAEVGAAVAAAISAARARGLAEEDVAAAAHAAAQETAAVAAARGPGGGLGGGGGSVESRYYELAHSEREEIAEQPSLLKPPGGATLREYQMVGLQWMVSLYNNHLNGILADEMGLGKTVQVMALIAYLMEKKSNYGPHLVIVPNAVIVNWKAELTAWLPGARCVYYVGGKDERARKYAGEVQSLQFNVLVTTYEFVMRDRVRLAKIDWQYIIIDEAQRMKDRQSKLAKDLDRFSARRRLLLSGTPLQNDLLELWSLLNLLLPDVFDDRRIFAEWFGDSPGQQGGGEDWLDRERRVVVVHRLHQILEPFMLRRQVEDVESRLPPKTAVVARCPMTPYQSGIYAWVKTTGTLRLDPSAPFVGKYRRDFASLNNKCMELRKLCNHPLLSYPIDGFAVGDRIVRQCGKMLALDRVLLKLCTAGHRVLLFSTMTRLLDLLEAYLQWRELPALEGDLLALAHAVAAQSRSPPAAGAKEEAEKQVRVKAEAMQVDEAGALAQGQVDEAAAVSQEPIPSIPPPPLPKRLAYLRIDGGTSLEERERAIQRFNAPDSEVKVFLLSIRAAGRGLNLQSADTVVIYDPDPNPKNEEQAIARSHRIGQTRDVRVVHLEAVADPPPELAKSPGEEGVAAGVEREGGVGLEDCSSDTKPTQPLPPTDPATVPVAPTDPATIPPAPSTSPLQDPAPSTTPPPPPPAAQAVDPASSTPTQPRRLYADSIESLVRNKIQKIKQDMANEVIDAGRFDQRTSMEERRATLESLLADESRAPRADNAVPTWSELDDALARTPLERELFRRMETELPWFDAAPAEDTPGWMRYRAEDLLAAATLAAKRSPNFAAEMAALTGTVVHHAHHKEGEGGEGAGEKAAAQPAPAPAALPAVLTPAVAPPPEAPRLLSAQSEAELLEAARPAPREEVEEEETTVADDDEEEVLEENLLDDDDAPISAMRPPPDEEEADREAKKQKRVHFEQSAAAPTSADR